MLIYATTAIAFGFAFSFFLNSGSPVLVTLFLCGMALMGLLMVLWELSCRNCFLRTFVIQTSLAFNMAGIIGAALRL
jgi:hypothetical protein